MPAPYVALNPADAEAAGFGDGAEAQLIANDNRYRLQVRYAATIAPGTAGVPIGFERLERALTAGQGRIEGIG
jgi:NADH-quinone oxidoreductase subunit G